MAEIFVTTEGADGSIVAKRHHCAMASKPIFGLIRSGRSPHKSKGPRYYTGTAPAFPIQSGVSSYERKTGQLGIRAWQARPLHRFVMADRLSFESPIRGLVP